MMLVTLCSLQITPACNLPLKSLRGGGKIVIVNLQVFLLVPSALTASLEEKGKNEKEDMNISGQAPMGKQSKEEKGEAIGYDVDERWRNDYVVKGSTTMFQSKKRGKLRRKERVGGGNMEMTVAMEKKERGRVGKER
ncbi:hypothetical protein CK203_088030 [Vitis vinifera]|uniref:Uncharacterized protein n=1 Tax=Vitis vinifera TaxID=29760 RepID=A0A438ERC9_VITVI|nr:hypothetical protein CK203_088030 [Vitis vinifera]